MKLKFQVTFDTKTGRATASIPGNVADTKDIETLMANVMKYGNQSLGLARSEYRIEAKKQTYGCDCGKIEHGRHHQNCPAINKPPKKGVAK